MSRAGAVGEALDSGAPRTASRSGTALATAPLKLSYLGSGSNSTGSAGMNAPTLRDRALSARIDDMVDACTRCGKCVEACPTVAPAGIADAAPQDVIGGVIDIVRTGEGPEASRTWASSCML